jgi:hypothetical protein
MERYGCQVYAFDPLMGLDQHDQSPAIHFYNWGLSNQDEFNMTRDTRLTLCFQGPMMALSHAHLSLVGSVTIMLWSFV